jgi:hypothetical protein
MEALMMNPAAAIPSPGCWFRATKHARRRGNSSGLCELEAASCLPPGTRAIPHTQHANFLEFPGSGFHYSVIGPGVATTRTANGIFNSVRALSSSVKAVPLRMHKEMIDGPSIKPRQFRFRTGNRKIDANGFASGGRDIGQYHVHPGLLMRLAKNIPATLPSYATIAPILHAQHVTPAQRGITFRIGAADATGR